MDLLCHRCGNSVHEGEGFCPHCGAQQLMVEASDVTAAQQPAVRTRGDTHTIEWRAAILSALLVAIPVGLLSGLTRLNALFPIGGGFAAIWLYRRRGAPFTDGRIGLRVGAILGTVSAFVATASYAVNMVVDRYVLHKGAAIDHEFQAAAQQGVEYWTRAVAQQGPQPPEMTNALHAVASFILSPDGHAANQLATAAVVSLVILLFAAVSGAIAGRVLAMRARVPRSL